MTTESLSDPLTEPARPQISRGAVAAYFVIFLAHLPLLYVYFQQLWSRPHYQFFPLVLLASAYFIADRWADRRTPQRSNIALSWLILLICVGLLAMAFAKLSPFLCCLSFVMLTGAFVLRIGIPAIGPWLLLFLLLRIPYGQDVAAIQTMQRVTTQLGSTALDTIGIEHVPEGNVLHFVSRSLFVEEACAGVVSMLALIACAAILAVWWRRSLLHGLLLMATGLFWAGAMNVLRVVVIAYALVRFDLDLLSGWRHGLVGLIVFAISLGALYSTDRLLVFLLGRITMNPLVPHWGYAEGNWLIRLWNLCTTTAADREDDEKHDANVYDWHNAEDVEKPEETHAGLGSPEQPVVAPRPWEWGIVPAFVLLGVAQVIAGIGPFSAVPAVHQAAVDLSSDDLPDELEGWTKIDFRTTERDSSSAFGEHSRIWTYRKGAEVAQLSCDFVFPEWHSLSACYAGIGWDVHSRSRVEQERTQVEAHFTKPGGEAAILLYDLFDSRGEAYVSPGGTFLHPQLRRIVNGEADRFTLPVYYQVQALVGYPMDDLPEDHRAGIHVLFESFAQRMKRLITEGNEEQRPSSREPIDER